MLDKTSGEVEIDWNDITDKDAVRRTFGIVFQDSSLDDDLTGWENMYFHAMLYGIPVETQEKEIKRLMEFVDLRGFKDRIVKQYSGWMKRRLEIARGLLHHPKILYLDEPTVWLDPQSRTHIWEYLKKINQEEGLTIFLTTHYMDEVEKIADKIAIIDHWKIQAIWSLDELKKHTGKQNLDEAFIAMTGRDIREELLSEADGNKARRKMLRR